MTSICGNIPAITSIWLLLVTFSLVFIFINAKKKQTKDDKIVVFFPEYISDTESQSHYREVPRWDIFMEEELRFGLDLGRLALLKEKKDLG